MLQADCPPGSDVLSQDNEGLVSLAQVRSHACLPEPIVFPLAYPNALPLHSLRRTATALAPRTAQCRSGLPSRRSRRRNSASTAARV